MWKNLKSKQGFQVFEELPAISRCSGNEMQVSNYLVGFGMERKFKVFQDKAPNVIIKKSGTVGYKNYPR